jgi:hypothetical protein
MFTGGKKEAALAPQITSTRDIIDRASDVEPGNPFISLVPLLIQ